MSTLDVIIATGITSFNQLFEEAKRVGLLLQTLHQAPDGRFVAGWRRGSGPGATHYSTAEHERPFDAALMAFQEATNADRHAAGDRFVEVVQVLNSAEDDGLFA
jgi:hypothetical protein